jgi:hypothetical protein
VLVRHRGSRGQSTAEFAMAMVLVVLPLLGIVDIGRAFYYAVNATDAARDGARTLASNTFPCSSGASTGCGPGTAVGCAVVEADLADVWNGSSSCPGSGSPTAGQVIVAISCPDSSGTCVSSGNGRNVTVDVSYGFQPISPLPTALITIHGQAVMASSW